MEPDAFDDTAIREDRLSRVRAAGDARLVLCVLDEPALAAGADERARGVVDSVRRGNGHDEPEPTNRRRGVSYHRIRKHVRPARLGLYRWRRGFIILPHTSAGDWRQHEARGD